MKITSAKFIKGVVGPDPLLEDGLPQIALVGRSNVGKSSLINALANQRKLARTSHSPGRTQEINVFLCNNTFYLLDLPGYGYARASGAVREWLHRLIEWYLLRSPYQQKKVVLIIDAKVGPTKYDLEMLQALEAAEKNIMIVANKADKIKKSEYEERLQQVSALLGLHPLFPCSAEKKIGLDRLTKELLG